MTHRGRFAPSPTGPLHFGSLVAAVGSYLCAKHSAGTWHLRIDDLDRARVVPGAADDILRTLEGFGFEWTGEVCYQSTRTEAYAAAAARLKDGNHLYECSCSRRELQALSQNTDSASLPEGDELLYPGLCRSGPLVQGRDTAARFRVQSGSVHFEDIIQGQVAVDVAREAGDFVIRRRDGLFAYQLACAVDDHAQGFTHVIRGADLIGSTARQLLLQRALSFTPPAYGHLPLALDAAGRKLAKSSAAPAVRLTDAPLLLWKALEFLQQAPPPQLTHTDLEEIWDWAFRHWSIAPIMGRRGILIAGET
jgi:glutamyl-Q tRNA(Asp) synthetase